MTKTTLGSDRNQEGQALPVRSYVAGEEIEIGESLAKSFIRSGVAKAVEGDSHVEASGKIERAADRLAEEADKPAEQVAPEKGTKRGGLFRKKDKGAAPENKGR